jgi:hypothetical protein
MHAILAGMLQQYAELLTCLWQRGHPVRPYTQQGAVRGVQAIGSHAPGMCHCRFVTTLEQCTATAQCRKSHTTYP